MTKDEPEWTKAEYDALGRRLAVSGMLLTFSLGNLMGWMRRDLSASIGSVLLISVAGLIGAFIILFYKRGDKWP